MHVFKWGNLQDENIYIDETTHRTIKILKIRENFGHLATALYKENKKDSAQAVLARCEKFLPVKQLPYSIYDFVFIEAFYKTQNNEKGDELITKYSNTLLKELDYYFNQEGKFKAMFSNEKQTNIAILRELTRITNKNKRMDLSRQLEEDFSKYYALLVGNNQGL